MEVSPEAPSNGAGETLSNSKCKFQIARIDYFLFFCFRSALNRELKNKQREEERKQRQNGTSFSAIPNAITNSLCNVAIHQQR